MLSSLSIQNTVPFQNISILSTQPRCWWGCCMAIMLLLYSVTTFIYTIIIIILFYYIQTTLYTILCMRKALIFFNENVEHDQPTFFLFIVICMQKHHLKANVCMFILNVIMMLPRCNNYFYNNTLLRVPAQHQIK